MSTRTLGVPLVSLVGVLAFAACGGAATVYARAPLESCIGEQATTFSMTSIAWSGQNFMRRVAPNSFAVRFPSKEEIAVLVGTDAAGAKRIAKVFDKLRPLVHDGSRMQRRGNVLLLLPKSLSAGNRKTLDRCFDSARKT